MILSFVADLLIGRAKKSPYESISDYMERFWLRKHNQAKSNWAARIHGIRRSDHDRALHDHPWDNASLVLKGGYWEVVPGRLQTLREADFKDATTDELLLHSLIHALPGQALSRQQRRALIDMGVFWRGPGRLVRRKAESLHRLVVPEGTEAWSLFVMGPKRREWGFADPAGWVHNTAYNREA